jgi:tetratricopeptide (TPR) repeat protein
MLLLGIIATGLFVELPASPGRLWWLGRLPDSVLRREATLHPGEPWPQYVLGMRWARRGQLRSAMEALRESTRRAPNEPLPLLGAAEVWMNAGRPERALIQAERAVEVAPRSALAHRVLGAMRLDAGAAARAAEELDAATHLDPHDAEAWYLLGRLFSQEQGETARSRAALERAVRLDPRHPEARRELALVLMRSGGFDAAERQAREALRLNPDDAMSHAALGAMLHRRRPNSEGLAQAKRELLRAIDLDPKLAPAHYELGLLFAEQQEWPAARAHLDTAVRLAPENQGAWYHLTRACEHLGDTAGARRARRRFQDLAETQPEVAFLMAQVERRPADTRSRLRLARLHRRRGEWPAALAQLRQVLSLQPRQPEALRALDELEHSGRIRRVMPAP